MPIAEVMRLQPAGTLIAVEGLEVGIMSRECVSRAEISKEHSTDNSQCGHYSSRYGTDSALAHSTVLCLDGVAVARQNSPHLEACWLEGWRAMKFVHVFSENEVAAKRARQ